MRSYNSSALAVVHHHPILASSNHQSCQVHEQRFAIGYGLSCHIVDVLIIRMGCARWTI
jgi:hypothetical protein